MTVRIVTDSTCDLPAETIFRYGIRVVPLYINVGNRGYLDGIDMKRDEFYTKLPTFPTHPTTAVPSPQKFRALYDSLTDEGATDILSIHISVALSAVVDVARTAAKETTSVPVTVFETAAIMAAEGCSVAEILVALNKQIKSSHVFAVLDTLEFLKRSGRMNKYLVGIASLLQIKPILTMHNGKPATERVRTRERAMKRLVEMLAAVGSLERIAIVHTHALPERIAELRAMAAHLLPKGEILTEDITPVIGAHIGPGALGFAVVGALK
jgi:fatty acid kinase fatty acid binding subunit